MVKKINIAGIQLDNDTVRESILRIEREDAPTFQTIEEISIDMLLMAESDGKLKEVLQSLDYTILSDSGILAVVDQRSMQRIHEIDEHDFYYELMKRMEKKHKNIFILGMSREELEDTKAGILRDFPECNIVGMEALEDCQGTSDSIVNEVNAATPDMVLSVLPTPEQEYFLQEHKGMLSANIWYGIGRIRLDRKEKGLAAGLRNYSNQQKLRRMASHYVNSHEGSS